MSMMASQIHQPHDCLLNRLFRRRSKKISKLRVTGLCAGNSPVTGEFPAQMASNAENVSIWWRHHVTTHAHVNFCYSRDQSERKTYIWWTTKWKGNFDKRLKLWGEHLFYCNTILKPIWRKILEMRSVITYFSTEYCHRSSRKESHELHWFWQRIFSCQ